MPAQATAASILYAAAQRALDEFDGISVSTIPDARTRVDLLHAAAHAATRELAALERACLTDVAARLTPDPSVRGRILRLLRPRHTARVAVTDAIVELTAMQHGLAPIRERLATVGKTIRIDHLDATEVAFLSRAISYFPSLMPRYSYDLAERDAPEPEDEWTPHPALSPTRPLAPQLDPELLAAMTEASPPHWTELLRRVDADLQIAAAAIEHTWSELVATTRATSGAE